ncbi:helix-turn-helix domain-containing protein [Bacillus paranthracis]|uniref:helix-turn-helix domain-containing protein n=1 Tax=Bacillus TaxID=1386 RepID=UPI00027A0EEB|nr:MULTISPECIES: helix-turn-helix transcriptional regulator [Bacillus]EJR13196.1 hypothetical protein II9_04453 [Bacillus cereus MSX-D12]KMP43465.1 hypothetical protein TU55_17630 [Bacillus cereus]KMP69670.1 hypothetical protein TU61_02410 [Bacillus cereus]MCC2427789.1 helix-turn-helix domain-containing protein [Bacillus paranthracis]MDC7739376.1 helix-turn-helix transcriptional regulator [Bacillus sp. FF-1]
MNIGQRLKELRKEKNLTQSELALRINSNQETISRVEKGKFSPNLDWLETTCHALDVTIEDFFISSKSQKVKQLNLCLQNLTEEQLDLLVKLINSFTIKK